MQRLDLHRDDGEGGSAGPRQERNRSVEWILVYQSKVLFVVPVCTRAPAITYC